MVSDVFLENGASHGNNTTEKKRFKWYLPHLQSSGRYEFCYYLGLYVKKTILQYNRKIHQKVLTLQVIREKTKHQLLKKNLF